MDIDEIKAGIQRSIRQNGGQATFEEIQDDRELAKIEDNALRVVLYQLVHSGALEKLPQDPPVLVFA